MKIPKQKPNLLRSVHNVLEFGKHKGKTVQQVMKDDPQWLHWALQNVPSFKLNRNAILLLPPDRPQHRGTIEDGQGGYLDHYGDPIPTNSYDPLP